MSYNKKYDFSFADVEAQDNYIIDIMQDAFTGSVTNISFAKSEPITISYAGEEKKKYDKLVFGSKATLKLQGRSVNQFDEFLQVNERDYRVDLNKEGVSETKYVGSFEVTSIGTTPKRASYVDPVGDFELTYQKPTLENQYPCYHQKIRMLIGGVEKVYYEPDNIMNVGDIPSKEVLDTMIAKLKNNDSSYSSKDTDTDSLEDRIIKTDNYSFNDSLVIEKYYEVCENTSTGFYEEFNGNFGDSYGGDNIQLKVDENGTVVTLADVTYSGQSKNEMIAELIDQINSKTNYKATKDEINEDKINVEYIGTSDASTYTLQYSTTGTGWDVTANGINEETTEGTEKIWSGFVLQGINEKKYYQDFYEMIIEATDGLKDLESRNYDNDTGTLSAIKIIAHILKKTGLRLNIYSACDKYENDMNSGTDDDPLAQKYINNETIHNEQCLEVLNKILYTQGAELRQSRGAWFITPVIKSGDVAYRGFDFEGNHITSETTTININENLSNINDFQKNDYSAILNRSMSQRIQPARKSLLYKFDYGLKNQLLKDPSFNVFDTSGYLKYWDYTDDGRYSQNEDDNLEIEQAGVILLQDIAMFDSKVTFEITFKGDIKIELRVNGEYWWKSGEWHDQPVETSATYIEEIGTSRYELPIGLIDTGNPSTIRIKLTSDNTETGDTLIIESVKLVPEYFVRKKGISQKLYYSNITAFSDKKEFEYKLGDVPSTGWARYMYLNSLFLQDYSQTNIWGGSSEKIVKLISKEIVQEICQPSKTIEGEIITKNFFHNAHVLYSHFDGITYKLAGGSYSVRHNRFTGKWVQIGLSDPGGLIIEDKLFSGEPKGDDLYDSESGTAGGGGGGMTEGEVLSLLTGYVVEFWGDQLDSSDEIILTHDLNRTNAIIIIAESGIPIESNNYAKTYETKNSVTIKIYKPYEDTTKFTARFL